MTTEEALALLAKGRTNLATFAELLGVRMNRAQRRWFKRIGSGKGWNTRRIVHVAANQIGKTLGLAIILLWAALYKIGVPTADPAKWFAHPYNWYHLAPSQTQAYFTLRDIRNLWTGAHPAQVDKMTLPTSLEGVPLLEFKKLEIYYDGVETYHGAQIQFRTSEDNADAIQGVRAAGISFDEAAFENNLIHIINTVLMMRLIASGGPLLLVSTPDGINDYYEVVTDIQNEGDEVEERTWIAPNGAVLVWSHISDNVGFGITQDMADAMEADLDQATKEQQLRGAFLEPSEAFFVPAGEILKAFDKKLPEEQDPKPGHRYVIFWDPSVAGAGDPTACIVLDVTKKPWVGVKMIDWPKPRPVTDLLVQMQGLHAHYMSASNKLVGRSQPLTAYDASSMGGVILRQFIGQNIHPSRGVDLAGPKKKLDQLTNLRAALTNGSLILPASWTPVQRQLLNYRLKDDKLTQDLVMATAGAAFIAARGFGGGSVSRPFDPSADATTRSPWA